MGENKRTVLWIMRASNKLQKNRVSVDAMKLLAKTFGIGDRVPVYNSYFNDIQNEFKVPIGEIVTIDYDKNDMALCGEIEIFDTEFGVEYKRRICSKFFELGYCGLIEESHFIQVTKEQEAGSETIRVIDKMQLHYCVLQRRKDVIEHD